MTDDFRGDTPHLIRCIEALLSMDADGALAPHGVGGHARALLSASAVRLAALSAGQAQPVAIKPLEWEPHFYAKTDELVSLTADLPGREQAYKIEPVTANTNARLFIEGRNIKPDTGHYWPIEAAKAAAQSDYEARIRSALVGGDA